MPIRGDYFTGGSEYRELGEFMAWRLSLPKLKNLKTSDPLPLNSFESQLEEALDESFPKGDKNRGSGLLMYAHAVTIARKVFGKK